MVYEVGNPVVVGLDAHWPQVYADKRLENMLDEIRQLGLKPIDNIQLISEKTLDKI